MSQVDRRPASQRSAELNAGLPARPARRIGGRPPVVVAMATVASLGLLGILVALAVIGLTGPWPWLRGASCPEGPIGPAMASGNGAEGLVAGPAGVLERGRESHTALLLPGGCVLVVGGFDPFAGEGVGSQIVTSAELWDPSCRCFRPAGSPTVARHAHAAAVLQDGRVAVFGGFSVDGNPKMLAAVEIWDPARRAFRDAGSMLEPRGGHTATLLPSGNLLIIGESGAELWDPRRGTSVAAGSLIEPGRGGHTATLLPGGRVLVVGGVTPGGVGLRGYASSAELWDPATAAFEPAGDDPMGRTSHTATLLRDGRVLVLGGIGGDGQPVMEAKLWDPRARSFADTGPIPTGLANHTATVLPDGRVLVIDDKAPTGAEIFDPRTGSLESVAGSIDRRGDHTATMLPGGLILLVGGMGSGETVGRAELLDPG